MIEEGNFVRIRNTCEVVDGMLTEAVKDFNKEGFGGKLIVLEKKTCSFVTDGIMVKVAPVENQNLTKYLSIWWLLKLQ